MLNQSDDFVKSKIAPRHLSHRRRKGSTKNFSNFSLLQCSCTCTIRKTFFPVSFLWCEENSKCQIEVFYSATAQSPVSPQVKNGRHTNTQVRLTRRKCSDLRGRRETRGAYRITHEHGRPGDSEGSVRGFFFLLIFFPPISSPTAGSGPHFFPPPYPCRSRGMCSRRGDTRDFHLPDRCHAL